MHTVCPQGYFRSKDDAQSSKCEACESGRYAADGGNIDAEACLACPLGWSNANEAASACEECTGSTFAGNTGSERCSLCPSGYFLPPAQEDHDLCRECPSGWSTHERKGQSECVSDAQVSILENQDMLRHIKNDPSQIYFVVKFNVAGNLTDGERLDVRVFRGSKDEDHYDREATEAAEIVQNPTNPLEYAAVVGNGTSGNLRFERGTTLRLHPLTFQKELTSHALNMHGAMMRIGIRSSLISVFLATRFSLTVATGNIAAFTTWNAEILMHALAQR